MGITLTTLTYAVPYFIVNVAGITYAAVQRRSHPRLSLIIMIALGLSILRLIAFDVLLPSMASLLGYGSYNFYGNMGFRMLSMGIGLCSHILLVVAAFYGFNEASKAERQR